MLRALRDCPATKALRQLIETAVDATVAAVAGHMNSERAEHLRLVLREHDTQVSSVTVRNFDRPAGSTAGMGGGGS